jgi:hypothetical protein
MGGGDNAGRHHGGITARALAASMIELKNALNRHHSGLGHGLVEVGVVHAVR